MKKAILYIHGKGGHFKEAQQYQKNCVGFDMIGLDYDDYFPWIVENLIKTEYEILQKEYESVTIIANSIGAYLAMYSLQHVDIEKALFISPILDMEKLILDMMEWANITEKELFEKKQIETEFGETLSWEYLEFVRKNPIYWNASTEILYARNDNLTSYETVATFIKSHNVVLTIMENGEHWFHTDEQLAFLDGWMKKAMSSFYK